uniref:Uncharacterized protein n=1 Tax=Anguilla anguilla TaxID=7936 RepID=A0A0E9TIX9_ANGAN
MKHLQRPSHHLFISYIFLRVQTVLKYHS